MLILQATTYRRPVAAQERGLVHLAGAQPWKTVVAGCMADSARAQKLRKGSNASE
jgi:hypothetical protein